MSSTRTQSQLYAATPISSFVQCHISFWLLPSSVATFFLIETLLTTNFVYNLLSLELFTILLLTNYCVLVDLYSSATFDKMK